MDSKEEKWLREEKYGGADSAEFRADLARLAAGEPLAYVIGHVPFLGLSIFLTSKPLIPRPETEWWTEKLIAHAKERIAKSSKPESLSADEKRIIYDTSHPFRVLDLCAGSGAIGLALLAHIPETEVTFAEIDPAHADTIRLNIEMNGLDVSRASILTGDLFAPLADRRFDVIATNPPYIPSNRTLDTSVLEHEPHTALFSGADGLSLIRRIADESPAHLSPLGELWMEVDSDHADTALALVTEHMKRAELVHDQYDRPRLVVGYL